MLTADLAMSRHRGDRIAPLYLEPDDANYAQAADDLIDIVRRHLGRRRAEMEKTLDEYIGIGADYRILRGLIKLLADRCRFETAAATDPADGVIISAEPGVGGAVRVGLAARWALRDPAKPVHAPERTPFACVPAPRASDAPRGNRPPRRRTPGTGS